MELKISALLDLSHTLAGDYLAQFEYPWQALDGIKDFILALGPTLFADEYDQPAPNVWVHKTAKVFPSAYLGAPCIIGPLLTLGFSKYSLPVPLQTLECSL